MILGPYVPGCSSMYCPVLSWYKVVQGGTRWYMTEQGTVYGGTWRYMAVQESVKLYILECTGTYLFLRFNLDPVDSLLQCCRAEGAVLRPVHLITVMQAQACFNQEVLGLPLPLPARRPGEVAPPERGGPLRLPNHWINSWFQRKKMQIVRKI